MTASRLQIIKPTYLEHYKKRQKFTLRKHFNKLRHIGPNLDSFRFYFSTSAVHSSQIEGIDVDIDSWMRYQEMPGAFKSKGFTRVQDLVDTYHFCHKHKLSSKNIATAHSLLSKHTLTNKYQGKYRDKMVYIRNLNTGETVFKAAPVDILKAEMHKLYNDIDILLKRELSINEVFYHAAMMHLVFANIHPYADGNGRMARLLEKWFLASKLGQNTWFIQSEHNYHKKRVSYYRNINTGKSYESLDYGLCLDFLFI